MFAAGELAMPAYDLAQWDISMMNRSLLAPKSYNEFFASVKLKDGSDTHYALGLDVRDLQGHAVLEHTGEVSGFTADNQVFPQDKLAIAVLTNQDAARAGSLLGHDLAPLLLGLSAQTPNEAEVQARALFENFQQGKIDRSLFTDWCNAYFDRQALGGLCVEPGAAGKAVEREADRGEFARRNDVPSLPRGVPQRRQAPDRHHLHRAGRKAGTVPRAAGELENPC